MGQHFGELAKNVRGIVVHKISPYEQKSFAGAITNGVPNTLRRINSQIFRVLPPFIFGYFVYHYVEDLHESYLRKNPKDFENDV